jgi:hypothetical protein
MPGYDEYDNPVKVGGLSTEHACAAIVFGALLFLFLVKRGFRGVSAGGVGVKLG